jgi:hypothetical protein
VSLYSDPFVAFTYPVGRLPAAGLPDIRISGQPLFQTRYNCSSLRPTVFTRQLRYAGTLVMAVVCRSGTFDGPQLYLGLVSPHQCIPPTSPGHTSTSDESRPGPHLATSTTPSVSTAFPHTTHTPLTTSPLSLMTTLFPRAIESQEHCFQNQPFHIFSTCLKRKSY